MHLAPMARIRIKFYSFAVLAAAGITIDAPIWSIVAPIFICVAIPLAVAAQGTGHVRDLFLPSRVAAPVPAARKAVRHAQIR
ncbi:hypothetical protein [Micromonospora sp. NPDC051296]|uniref:hypothetical protein n=1 Tax=Micromonospora sp. NPDC051296 TaxID=3155046 RepID=UPI003416AED7